MREEFHFSLEDTIRKKTLSTLNFLMNSKRDQSFHWQIGSKTKYPLIETLLNFGHKAAPYLLFKTVSNRYVYNTRTRQKKSFSIYVINKQLEILTGKKITVSVATQSIMMQEI